MVSPPTKKNSSNLNESQELSGPLQKKIIKKGKILKTFTHASSEHIWFLNFIISNEV